MLPIKGLSLIGRSESLPNDQFFYGINPVKNQNHPTPFYQATSDEVEKAICLADIAFQNATFASISTRVNLLQLISKNIQHHSEQLTHWYCLETGLPNERAIAELKRACYQFESYAEALLSGYALNAVIDSGDPHRKPTSKPALRKVNVPLGPVVVFGASNFPFAYGTIGGDVAAALAAGCPVIVKGHAMHPHTSELAARIIQHTLKTLQLNEGIFSHLVAENYAVGEQLVAHPKIKAVGFTGSIKGGKALISIANKRLEPIPVFAEMGSVNPIIITANALRNNTDSIADQIAQSIALNAGQFCTSPGIVFLEDSSDAERFIALLANNFSLSKPQIMLHPTLFGNYIKERDERLLQADSCYLGQATANAITPTLAVVSSEKFLQNNTLQDEVFGSFVLIVLMKERNDFEKCINQLVGQLTMSIFSEPGESISDVMKFCQNKAGRLIFNGVPTGVEVTTAMQHGGPYPSSSNSQSTAVGADAVKRFMRPIAFQNCPENALPETLKDENPLAIYRFVDGVWKR